MGLEQKLKVMPTFLLCLCLSVVNLAVIGHHRIAHNRQCEYAVQGASFELNVAPYLCLTRRCDALTVPLSMFSLSGFFRFVPAGSITLRTCEHTTGRAVRK